MGNIPICVCIMKTSITILIFMFALLSSSSGAPSNRGKSMIKKMHQNIKILLAFASNQSSLENLSDTIVNVVSTYDDKGQKTCNDKGPTDPPEAVQKRGGQITLQLATNCVYKNINVYQRNADGSNGQQCNPADFALDPAGKQSIKVTKAGLGCQVTLK